MPTVLRHGSYRFFFYAGDRDEPMHIHVERGDRVAKYWLEPLRLTNSGGFKRSELAEIHRILSRNRLVLIEAWDDYFNG